MAKKLKLLTAFSEVHPFAKTGGLGDIAGALPKALKKMGHDVRIIMPKYSSVNKQKSKIKALDVTLKIPLGDTEIPAKLYESKHAGKIPIYFVGNDSYFNREGLYGNPHQFYPDNAERFIFFNRAILETCKALNFQPDIIHSSDWETGLIAVFLKTVYSQEIFFHKTHTVFSIHNLGYQGNFSYYDFELSRLPNEIFTSEGVEFFDQFSFLKSGLVYSDLLTTVSKTYCREILTPENGFGLEGVLKNRGKDLFGVLNGIDRDEWNPGKDKLIKKTFSLKSLKGKLNCKKDLIKSFGLKIKESTPIFCMVTRLFQQKGIDLIMQGFEKLMGFDSAFILLGSGEDHYENFFIKQAKIHKGKFACQIGFDNQLAHKILAGSDIFLMPSLYEPCGLTQMYALRYGTVPVVRSVGGLQDTVVEFNPKNDKGTGFKFNNFESGEFLDCVQRARALYDNPKVWRRVMMNGMKEDFSWDKAAQEYARIYKLALRK